MVTGVVQVTIVGTHECCPVGSKETNQIEGHGVMSFARAVMQVVQFLYTTSAWLPASHNTGYGCTRYKLHGFELHTMSLVLVKQREWMQSHTQQLATQTTAAC